MRVDVYNKFKQNPKIAAILKGTGTKRLYEHTHRDDYWADGHPRNDPHVHGEGKNMLGKILEEVRYILDPKNISDRYESMGLSGGRWLIPGMFILADVSTDECIEAGYRYIYSDEEAYGCRVEGRILIANWRDSINDKSKIEIARTIETAVSRGLPVVISHKHTDIAKIAMQRIYGSSQI